VAADFRGALIENGNDLSELDLRLAERVDVRVVAHPLD
jgi:hypothetical protein